MQFLKAGGAYLPLDPEYPVERLRLMIDDSQCPVVLTSEKFEAKLRAIVGDEGHLVLTDMALQDVEGTPSGTPSCTATSRDLAYVIYTSGSTGTPKGVMLEHRGAVNVLTWLQHEYSLNDSDRIPLHTSFTFDVSVSELFWPLTAGASIVVTEPGGSKDPAYLYRVIEEEKISVIDFVPSLLSIFLEAVGEKPSPGLALRHILCAGEALSSSLTEKCLKLFAAEVSNLYGPTEASIYSSFFHADPYCLSEAPAIPIGRPVGNVQLYVLDGNLNPVPAGIPGELHIGGAGLARGYQNSPGLTAAKFVPDPFSGIEGARLYRTGDSVRLTATGEIEFIGRLDNQVKLRGFRIELQEIEALLLKHPSVAEAAVTLQKDDQASPFIAAHIVARDAELRDSELRTYLRTVLPEYMIPATFARLDAFPLTSSGKVDRRSLHAGRGSSSEREILPPSNPVEELLGDIWKEVIGLDDLGTGENFFEIGGHSLSATQVVSRICSIFSIDLPIRALFECPTLKELGARVSAELGGHDRAMAPLSPMERREHLPLSFAQKRLWFLDRLVPDNPFYVIPVALQINGPLHVKVLEQSFSSLIMRHETLRTNFLSRDGEPFQIITTDPTFHLFQADLSLIADEERHREVERTARFMALLPFSLSDDLLIRAVLLRLEREEHVLLITVHHIIADGWSMGVLARDLVALYQAHRNGSSDNSLPPLAVQYADFALWQERWLTGDRLDRQAQYWKTQLEGAPVSLPLPCDRPRPRLQSFRGSRISCTLDLETLKGLKNICRKSGATLFMTLLAAFDTLLYRWTGETDILTGSPVANRTHREIEDMIGFFVNTLVLRSDLAGDPSFYELLSRTRKICIDAYAHQDIPFEKLLEELNIERSLDRQPLVQVLFALQNNPMPSLSPSGLAVQNIDSETVTVRFDLEVHVTEEPSGLRCDFIYSSDLFDAATIDRMALHYKDLLGRIVKNPAGKVSELAVLSGGERHKVLVEWNETETDYRLDEPVHRLVEAQARKTPDTVALSFGDHQITYHELDREADRIARYLCSQGIGPDIPVGIYMERSLQMVIAVLAVLKAGGACVPIDPGYPAERIRIIAENSQAVLMLTGDGLTKSLPATGLKAVRLSEIIEDSSLEISFDCAPGSAPRSAPRSAPGSSSESSSEGSSYLSAQADSLAYIIYTSGSMGLPKGVAMHHRTLVNLVRWQELQPGLSGSAKTLQYTSLSFDVAFQEIFTTLCTGGTLVLVSDDLRRDPGMLAEYIEEQQIMRLYMPFVALQQLAEMCEETHLSGKPLFSLQHVITAGEQLRITPALRELFLNHRDCRLHNHYGPTESHVVTAYSLDERVEEWSELPPIGRPISNTAIYILDDNLEPLPIGVTGDLHIGGVNVARGYLNDPALTAGRFIPDPFGTTPGSRLYVTGDRARFLASGEIEFMGRLDGQVKIRGFRVELQEIEQVLGQHSSISNCAVVARKGSSGLAYIAAYVAAGGSEITQGHLRAFLREKLPEYMIPSVFVIVDSLPLTPSGKVDRRSLPAPERSDERLYQDGPATPTEEMVAAIWQEVLDVERPSVLDSFFEIGGHSLYATQVISRIERAFSIDLPIRAIFESPSIRELSSCIDMTLKASQGEAAPPILPVKREMDIPLSWAQERLWFLDQLVPDNPFYNMSTALQVEGTLDIAALQACYREIVNRHESLRTHLVSRGGKPVQIIDENPQMSVPVVDLSRLRKEDRLTEGERLAQDEALRPFNLSEDMLIRAALLRCGADDHVLLTTMHHIVSDGWSSGVFIRDMVALYDAFAEGSPSPLPPLPIQYADYAVWQRRWLSGRVLETQLEYWKARLEGAPTFLNLPCDHLRPPIQSFSAGLRSCTIDREITLKLRALSERAGTTLFMTLLSAFAVLMHKYTGDQDILIGSPVANRNHREIEGLIGFFVNTLVLRSDLTADPSFDELLSRTRKRCIEAYTHQDIPFEKLVDELNPERSMGRQPLVQVIFALQNTPTPEITPRGLTISPMEVDAATVRFDLEVHVYETPSGLECLFRYSSDLFTPSTVDDMMDHFMNLLEAVAESSGQRVSDLRILSSEEQDVILREWNVTAPETGEQRCIHRIFESQVERSPDAVALIYQDIHLTYQELNSRANAIARHLIELGVGPEKPVGICSERSADMVLAILAILKAGGAYVPLDPMYPEERLRMILEDSAIEVILTHHSVKNLFSEIPITHILSIDDSRYTGGYGENPEGGAVPENLAYIIYTSGSTGKPKGTLIPHRQVTRLFTATESIFNFSADDIWSCFHSYAFDFSVWEIWGALFYGGRTVVVPYFTTRDPEKFHLLLEEERVTVLSQIPTAFIPLAEVDSAGGRKNSSLRYIIFGGEALDAGKLSTWWEDHAPSSPQLVNMFGITEITVHGTWHFLQPSDVQQGNVCSPIGRRLRDLVFYVLDKALNPVSPGVPGELYIGGAGLARGYLNRPDLTALRFVPDPFSGMEGGRLYRTGDLVRYLHDGSLDYLGRIDNQVKIRGFRIEPGEIENVLAAHPAVQEAAVMAQEASQGGLQLTAYAVPRRESPEIGDILGECGRERISHWQELYDITMSQAPSTDDISFNITGWNSSYTGMPIPADEMGEWVEETVRRILSKKPEHVLEIGCGNGLLLSRIAPRCKSYHGTDFSQVSLNHVEKIKASLQGLECVTLSQREADNFEGLRKHSFDSVILNSIIQYFPSVEYLLKVIEGSLEMLQPGGWIFIGDVRNLQLKQAYYTDVALYKALPSMPVPELKKGIEQAVMNEEELLVEPQFFTALKERLAAISHVTVMLKKGRSLNELTKFRYDAFIFKEGPLEEVKIPWLDWKSEGLDLQRLCDILGGEAFELTGLQYVPNSRVQEAVKAVEVLAGSKAVRTAGELRDICRDDEGTDPCDLWALEDKYPYSVEILWERGYSDGSFDVIFRHSGSEAHRIPILDRKDPLPSAWSLYVNDPLMPVLRGKLVPQLRAWLRDRLPEYMVPQAIVILDAFPLSPSGKVDRKSLPAPGRQTDESHYAPASTPTEELLAGIWKEVLLLDKIGIHDNFFETGGHSLSATQVMSRVCRAFSVEVPLRAIFESPTIAALSTVINTAMTTGAVEVPPMERAERTGPLPLSWAQERLWFLDELMPGSPFYNMPVALRISGAVDVQALGESLQEMVRRHECLRTRLISKNGVPVQVIMPAQQTQLPLVDLTYLQNSDPEVKRLAVEEAGRPFNLAEDQLVRAALLRCGKSEHVLLFTMHHIVSDGWSIGVFIREMAALYESFLKGTAPALPPLPVQYADFAVWQRKWLSNEMLDRQRSYWKTQLEGAPAFLPLPSDLPRPPVQSFRAEMVSANIDLTTLEQLKALSARSSATLFMTLYAAFAALMHRWSGMDDILTGAPVANRTHREIENLIGFFVNTLVLRSSAASDPAFCELLEKTRKTCLDAYMHQDIPFEKLVEELNPVRSMDRHPLVQVLFSLQNAPMPELSLPGLSLSYLEHNAVTARVDLEVNLLEGPSGLEIDLIYCSDLFLEATIRQVMRQYIRILEAVIGNAGLRISELPLLSPDGRDRALVEWNATARDYRAAASLHSLFEEQVEKTPDALALVFEEQHLSYRELDNRARRLARRLKALGVGAEVTVGICMERSLSMVVAIYAVLKAGGAYVPMDPEYPEARLQMMIEDSRLEVLITEERFKSLYSSAGVKSLLTFDASSSNEERDDNAEDLVSASEMDREISSVSEAEGDLCSPENLVSMIFTSGSTGRPKGVQSSHRGIINRLLWMQEAFNLDEKDRVLQKTPYSFDVSMWEFFWPLFTGAALVIAGPGEHRDPAYLAKLIKEEKVTTIHFVPSMLRAFLDNGESRECSSLIRVICSGEALPFDLEEKFFAACGAELYNLYGPTEASIDVSYWRCTPGSSLHTVPIGRPIANTQLYVTDSNMNPVPPGFHGELYIGGEGLARGYGGSPEMTAERFIPDPFSLRPGARLYRTGDKARYLSDGAIDFLGRLDGQVKLRGFRVETGEIESAIAGNPSIRENAVIMREDSPGSSYLAAYIVPASLILTGDEIRAYLKGMLPEYMIPSTFTMLDSLPRTASGKVDRRALPAPDGRTGAGEYVPPANYIEETLASVWREILGIEKAGIHDNFFALGGHSLHATQVITRINKAFSIDLPLREIFRNPTIAELEEIVVITMIQDAPASKVEELLSELE